MKRVAIEGTLDNIGKYLSEQGYEIVNLDPKSQTGAELRNCQAVVISGMDKDIAGMQTALTNSPVIDATGMSPEQVHDQLKQRIGAVKY